MLALELGCHSTDYNVQQFLLRTRQSLQLRKTQLLTGRPLRLQTAHHSLRPIVVLVLASM